MTHCSEARTFDQDKNNNPMAQLVASLSWTGP
jgi:hypothetical protein